MNKTQAKAKATSIKTSVDAVHVALAANDVATATVEFDRLHAKLNGAAHKLAEFFDEDPSTFSGGTDRPQAE